MPKYRYALVTCARWEEQNIVEWLEYHRSIGFEHVYLYCNDEDPSLLLHMIVPYVTGPNPFVTYRYWPRIGDQPGMYFHFLENHVRETEWCAFLDADEFFVFKGADNVDTFLAPYRPVADVVYFHWLRFGANGAVKRQNDLSLLLTRTMRAAHIDRHTKMLCRSSMLDAGRIRAQFEQARGRFWYFLDNYDLPGARHVGVLGNDMKGYAALYAQAGEALQPAPEVSDEMIGVGYVAHFQIQAEIDFARRYARGGFAEAEHWRALAETGKFKEVLEGAHQVYDPYLATYWYHHLAGSLQYATVGAPDQARGVNIALNKPTRQSSVYRRDESSRGRVATYGKANNGSIHCVYGFHTEAEENPWIIVDLLDNYQISEIRLFNRIDDPLVISRARPMLIEISCDGTMWQERYFRDHETEDWTELTIPDISVTARYVRFSLRAMTYFHLREIEIF